MEEKTRLQKIVFRALLVMILVFGVLMAVSRFQKGVAFDDTLLKVRAAEGRTAYTGKKAGQPLTITVTHPAENTARVEYVLGTETREVYTMEYPLEPFRIERGGTVPGICVLKDGKTLFEGGYDPNQQMGWYDKDGSWAWAVEVRYGDEAENAALNERNVAYFARGPELTHRGSWLGYLGMVLLTLLLMLDVHCPEFFFNLRYCWHVEDPEPTAFYRRMQEVGWMVYPFLLLIGYLIAWREIQ